MGRGSLQVQGRGRRDWGPEAALDTAVEVLHKGGRCVDTVVYSTEDPASLHMASGWHG